MPTAIIAPGVAPNNKGQFGSNTTADASSAYTIASTILPKPLINNTPTQLGIIGDPNSLTIDPARNSVYVLADTNTGFHQGFGSNTPLFLVRIDLSQPVFGASPTAAGNLRWNPVTQTLRLP